MSDDKCVVCGKSPLGGYRIRHAVDDEKLYCSMYCIAKWLNSVVPLGSFLSLFKDEEEEE